MKPAKVLIIGSGSIVIGQTGLNLAVELVDGRIKEAN